MGFNPERLRGKGENKTERLFYSVVVGLARTVEYQSRPIISPYPVADRYEVVRKTKTVPDYYLEFDDGRYMYVEVTKGSGDVASKAAQLRVVQAAGETNYRVLTGDEVNSLAQVESLEHRRGLLFSYFGW